MPEMNKIKNTKTGYFQIKIGAKDEKNCILLNLCKRWRGSPATMARLTWLIHSRICISDEIRKNVILSFLLRKKLFELWPLKIFNTCVCLTSRPCWTGQRERILKKEDSGFLGRISLGYFPKKVLPEIYLAVDDDQEEKRENAVYDHVGVGQINLIRHLTFPQIWPEFG